MPSNVIRMIGVLLIIVGILGFAFGGFSFTEEETVVDVGPIEVQEEQERRVPFGPVASGVAVIAGIALVIVGGRRT